MTELGGQGPLPISTAVAGGCLVARPEGELETASYPHLRDSLLKLAAEVPDALIVVLDGLRVAGSHLLSVFSLVWMRVSEWPGVPVMLVVSDPDRAGKLRRTAMARYVSVYESVRDAVLASTDTPAPRRARLMLPADPAASAQARSFVDRTCAGWGIAETTVDEVRAVVTELVENALQHTLSSPSLRLELRKGILTAAVGDDSPAPAVLREGENGETAGWGLLLVSSLANVWGCTPTIDGGKVVWASFTPRARGRSRQVRPWTGR